MSFTHQLAHRIENMWWEAETPPLLLRALSPLYRRISQIDQAKRLEQAITPPIPLISIGNITVGGSGKTPFVVWLATQLQQQDRNPVILCRGDGGRGDTPQLLNDASLASDVGDEAVLLHRRTGCPVISAQNRLKASHMAANHGDIILLDDGFQYRQLHRICDIVLISDARIGNGHLLPAGPLREPTTALQRADIVVSVGKHLSQPLSQQREWLWHTTESTLSDWMKCQQTRPQRVIAITAIARPQRFIHSLNQAGIQVESFHFFPDHHAFNQDDLATLLASPHAIAVTAKDAVKLQAIWPENRPLWVLEQQAEGEKGLLEKILTSASIGQASTSC